MAPKDEHLEQPPRFSVSRRDFLKTAGISSLAARVAGVAEAETQAGGAAVVGPGEVPVQLMVNGKRLDLRIEPRVTLLDALRNRADLTGNKRVCDRGACGACTMIVDGLANGAALHPVQQAFCDVDALMCGFCTPGFVMASVALLEKNPNPTPEQVRKGLDGNICRCGTFTRIMEATMKARGVTRA